jgi:hypothetical protein
MAPTGSKRSRPAFSPPRPGKSKAAKSAKDQSANGVKRGQKTVKGSRVEKKTPAKRPRAKKAARGAGGTIRAFLDEEADGGDDQDQDRAQNEGPIALSDEGEPEGDDDEDLLDVDENDRGDRGDAEDMGEEAEEEEEEDEDTAEPSNLETSPEPDFILAEITHNGKSASDTASEPTIPLPLIHRIMQSHFSRPEKTSISADARVLAGKYIEIFVKEGIRRCVDEKKEREKSGTAGAGAAVDCGWLELEDLERVATQLCMDF